MADEEPQDERQALVLGFARLMMGTATDPLGYARERGWIDADGAVTRAGEDLIEALSEQAGTRTVFRGV